MMCTLLSRAQDIHVLTRNAATLHAVLSHALWSRHQHYSYISCQEGQTAADERVHDTALEVWSLVCSWW